MIVPRLLGFGPALVLQLRLPFDLLPQPQLFLRALYPWSQSIPGALILSRVERGRLDPAHIPDSDSGLMPRSRQRFELLPAAQGLKTSQSLSTLAAAAALMRRAVSERTVWLSSGHSLSSYRSGARQLVASGTRILGGYRPCQKPGRGWSLAAKWTRNG